MSWTFLPVPWNVLWTFLAAPWSMSWTLPCCTLKCGMDTSCCTPEYVTDTSLLHLKMWHGHFLLHLRIRHGHFLAVPYNLSWTFPSFALKYTTTTSLQTVFNLLPIRSRYSVFGITTTHWLDSPSFGSFQRKWIFLFQKFSRPAMGPT